MRVFAIIFNVIMIVAFVALLAIAATSGAFLSVTALVFGTMSLCTIMTDGGRGFVARAVRATIALGRPGVRIVCVGIGLGLLGAAIMIVTIPMAAHSDGTMMQGAGLLLADGVGILAIVRGGRLIDAR